MSKQIQIRSMNLEDIDEVYLLGSREEEFGVIEEGERFWKRKVLENWVTSDENIAIVANSGNELAGFLLATYHPITRKGTIENTYVKLQYRNLSTASMMYMEAERRLIEKNADFVCAFVESSNDKSKRFLERCGFDSGKQYIWMNKFY